MPRRQDGCWCNIASEHSSGICGLILRVGGGEEGGGEGGGESEEADRLAYDTQWCEDLGDDVREAACRILFNSLQTGARARFGNAVAGPVVGPVAGTSQLKLTTVQVVADAASAEARAGVNGSYGEEDVVKHLYVSRVAASVLGALEM